MTFYLSTADLADLDLDTNVIDITFPELTRNYSKINKFSDGAIIDGMGNLSAGIITFSFIFKKKYTLAGENYTATNTWNAFRYYIMKYFGMAKNSPVYFNITDSTGAILRQRIYLKIIAL
jgi:hypothetical protein